MTRVDRITLLVVGRLASGALADSYMDGIIRSAVRACDAIDVAARDPKISNLELRKLCGE